MSIEEPILAVTSTSMYNSAVIHIGKVLMVQIMLRYMGRTPEIVTAMLACARIGAIHSVVYGGFSVESLTESIEDSQSRVLVVADGAYQRGKIVPL